MQKIKDAEDADGNPKRILVISDRYFRYFNLQMMLLSVVFFDCHHVQ